MARFYPLYVRRSDGQLVIMEKKGRRESNTPTDEQMDQRPDRNGVADFYREVGPTDAKHMDWRRKLGGMLAREIGVKDKAAGMFYPTLDVEMRASADVSRDNGYILAVFPENYRLYEHVKKTEKDGKTTELKTKTHAGGGNDRQDAYLYGHPLGRKKRFRSPADFFPHLLWLCTDESGDPDNCGCKVCSPEDLENAIPGAKVKLEKAMKQEETKPVPFQTNAMQRRPSQDAPKPKQEPAQKLHTTNQPTPSPLPQPKTADQRLDSQYNIFIYRPGEMVWFSRGQAWGLGVVLRRWASQVKHYHYHVQPLSHPWAHPQPNTISSDKMMRPWLAWSVPNFTNAGLNNLPNPPTYDAADWNGILQKRYGTGDPEVDASILAAKAIDASYTPFSLSKTTNLQPGVTENHYDGIFLGAEKLWVGDPLRLHIGSGTDIMVLTSVVELTRNLAFGNQTPDHTVRLVGDVYTLATVSHSNPNVPTPAAPNSNPQLPQRLTEDLAWRNARTISTKRTASYWKLISSQSRLDMNDVKGRWYEASLILPILQPEIFNSAAAKGDISEASLWMNSRGDCINANRSEGLPKLPKQNVRKQDRRQAFGKAVPANVAIVDGIDPQAPQVDLTMNASSAANIDPRFDTTGNHSPELAEGGGGGLDEFMNLDGMDENGMEGSQLPGFGQEYGSQGLSQRGYF